MSTPRAVHPETLEHVEAQPNVTNRLKRCGCSWRQGDWALCSFHDGYDEGIDLARRREAP